jgi:hypothetical protein
MSEKLHDDPARVPSGSCGTPSPAEPGIDKPPC